MQVDFLNERLGDHEETWAGKNVAAFLSREMIEELETCFQVRIRAVFYYLIPC